MNNDNRIRDLKHKIEQELANIKKISKNFCTNLILNFSGNTYNLQVVDVLQLKELLIRLHLYQTAIDDISLKGFVLSGFMVKDWIFDINKLLAIKEQELRISKLKKEYNKLSSLLSTEAQTTDYLDDLECYLEEPNEFKKESDS